MIRIAVALMLTAASVAVAQSAAVLWEPPKLDVPDSIPKPSISKEMISKLRVGAIPITLEETPLSDVQKKLGGTIGARGDASEALQWLCLRGSDAKGRWALWLESDEMGGGTVDGFAWQRISNTATFDRRCTAQDVQVDLPIRLVLGSSESDVRAILGTPTTKFRQTLIYDHEHQETLHNEPFTSSNTLYIGFRDREVWTVQAWKITSN